MVVNVHRSMRAFVPWKTKWSCQIFSQIVSFLFSFLSRDWVNCHLAPLDNGFNRELKCFAFEEKIFKRFISPSTSLICFALSVGVWKAVGNLDCLRLYPQFLFYFNFDSELWMKAIRRKSCTYCYLQMRMIEYAFVLYSHFKVFV